VSGAREPTSRYGPLFWTSLVVGWTSIVFGLVSAWSHMGPSARTSFVLFLVGAAVVHDAVVAPIAIVVGTLVAGWAPRIARAAISGALIVSATVTLAAWPVVRRYGELADNPSFLPNAAGIGLLVVIAGVWAVAGAKILRARSR
jgi:hypothetical protein